MIDSQILINILIYSGIPTLVALYITERIKGSIKNSFDEKLEVIKKQHELEISNVQIELTHLKSKENFKFTKLHEKRLEILGQVYKFMIKNLDLLGKFISDYELIRDKSTSNLYEKEIEDEYRILFLEFTNYCNINAIYFTDEVPTLINEYIKEASTVYIDYILKYNTVAIMEFSEDDIDVIIKESRKSIKDKLLPVKKQIEVKFRELLGE